MLNIPFRCEQSISISKHISVVSPVIGDFNSWSTWSPWLCMEKDCQVFIAGRPNEVGHRQEWDGQRIGSGNIEITEISDDLINYQLEFIKPWKSTSKVEFRLEGKGGETKVAWVMDGKLPIFMAFFKKIMRAGVESDFARGLSMLKDYLEKGRFVTDTEVTGHHEQAGFHYLGVRRSSSIEDMPSVMSKDFGQLMEWASSGQMPEPDDFVSFYHKYDLVKKRCDFTSALVYREKPENTQNIIAGQIPSHNVLRVVHTGPYDYLGNAWSTVMAEQRNKKLKMNKKVPWYERYINSPEDVEPEELVTEINIPIK